MSNLPWKFRSGAQISATGVEQINYELSWGANEEGTLIYQTDNNELLMWDGSAFQTVNFGTTFSLPVTNYGGVLREASAGDSTITAYWQMDSYPSGFFSNSASWTKSIQIFSWGNKEDQNIQLFGSNNNGVAIRPDGTYMYINNSIQSISYNTHLRTDDVIHLVYNGSTLDVWINDTKIVDAVSKSFTTSQTTAVIMGELSENYAYNGGVILRQAAFANEALSDVELNEITRMVTDWTETSGYSKYDNHWKFSKTALQDVVGSINCTEVKDVNDVIEYMTLGEPFASPATLSDGSITLNNDEVATFELTDNLNNPDNSTGLIYSKVSGESWMTLIGSEITLNPTVATTAGNYTSVFRVDDNGITDDMTLTATITALVSIFSEDFESGIGSWTIVDDAATVNQWELGTATNNGGSNAMYVSNDGGTSNTYTTSDAGIAHAYVEFTTPADVSGGVTLNFDWKGIGESSYDFMNVFVAPTTVTPVGGTEVSVSYNVKSQTGSNSGASNRYNTGLSWASESEDISALVAASTTYRLILSWKNDTSGGTNPPAAIDNIIILVG